MATELLGKAQREAEDDGGWRAATASTYATVSRFVKLLEHRLH
ncbi:hypothetical protein [Nonomuraea sp. PA05]|nr:hypothetical protein [Nonomuraea sp. PA05]